MLRAGRARKPGLRRVRCGPVAAAASAGSGAGGAGGAGAVVLSAGAPSSVASYAARRWGSSSTSAASLNIRNWPAPVPGSNLSVAERQACFTASGEASRSTPRTSYQVGLVPAPGPGAEVVTGPPS